jgi:predicted RNA methylase
MLPLLMRIASLLPTHTRRSEESESLQQFSTPIGLAFVASVAAAITPADVVLEPSAGTGLLAILAELAVASVVLNELADSRAGILSQLFPAVCTTQFDAAHINDHLGAGIVPSIVLMNPPFSAAVHVDRKRCATDCAPLGSSQRSSRGSCACSTDASGAEVLAKVLDHYAIERIAEREAA